jgi:hypothetical protein
VILKEIKTWKKYYLVTVEETLSRTYKVKASSLEEAEEKMEYAYREEGTIILDADDFVCGEVQGREVKDEDLSLYMELEDDNYFEDCISNEEEQWSYEDRNYEKAYHNDDEDFDDSAAWEDDSNIGCKDCPDDECTGHCMSCCYRSV